MTHLLERFAVSFRAARQRGGDEFEQGIFRILFVSLFAGYLLVDALLSDAFRSHAVALLLATSYLLVAIVILYAIYRSPQLSHLRHTVTMVTDISVTTGCLYLAGVTGAVLYVIYLWLSIGNGFRYGLRYLFLCTVLSLIGFGILLYTSDYWGQHFTLGVGLLIGLAVLPLFSSILVRRLNLALRRSEEASKAKSQFVANMSHELRTPLNGVVGMTHLLMNTPLSPVAKEYTRAILSSSRTLLSLIDNILDLSKIEAGKVEIEIVDFDLYGLLHGVHAMFASHAKERGLRLMLHVDPATPATMRGDPTHIRQVLINLIGNAIKFTERGFVDIRVLSMVVDEQVTHLRFEITDTGIGIAPDALGRIFEIFTQADASTTRKFGGTGLGTTIAKQLVEIMGGTINATSTPGTGTTFYFDLPFTPAPTITSFQSRIHARVLVVGKLPAEGFTADSLNRTGDVITWYPTSTQAFAALSHAAHNDEPYHAVVINQEACDLDAMQFVARLLRDSLLAPLTTILLYQDGDSSSPADYLEAGYSFVFDQVPTNTVVRNVLRFACAHTPLDEGDAGWATAAATPLKILVAEDNHTNQLVIRGIVEAAGHQAVVVSDGEQAINALTSGQYDLAIIDMQMPKMSGIDVIKYVKWTLPKEFMVPFIVLTANATKNALEECMAAGASAFVTKPVKPARLLVEIETLANRSGARASMPASDADAKTTAVKAVEHVNLDSETLDDLRALGHPDTLISSVVNAFEEDAERLLDQMRTALNAERFSDFRECVHALRGCAGSIGAKQLQAHCAAVERFDDRQLVTKSSNIMHDLVNAYQATCGALLGYLNPAMKPPPPVSRHARGDHPDKSVSRRR